MNVITTVSGDTWDMIAKRVYGDERKAQILMEARENVRLLDIQIFSAGVTVTVPDIPQETADADDLPDWRK